VGRIEKAERFIGTPVFAHCENKTIVRTFAACKSVECKYIRSVSNPNEARNVCISGPDAQMSAMTRAVYAMVDKSLFRKTPSGTVSFGALFSVFILQDTIFERV
jgi:hypothetical protein